MADYVEKLILDDSQFVSGLDEVIKKTNQAEKEFSELNKEVSESQKQMGKEITDTSKKIEKANQDTAKSHRAETEELKKKLGQYKIFGVSLDDVKQRLSGYMTSLKGVLKSMRSFGSLSVSQKKSVVQLSKSLGGGRSAFLALAKAAHIFKVALVSTGIGAIVVALGSLIAFLTQTQKGMDLVERATTAVGVVFSKLTKAAADLGEDIVEAFTSPKKAFEDLGKSIAAFIQDPIQWFKDLFSNIKGFVGGVVDAVAAVDDLTVQLQKLRREQAENNVEFAKQRAEIERLKKIGDDITKSYSERTKAIRTAGQMEIKISKQKADDLAKEIELLENIAKTKENDDFDAVNNEIIKKRLEYYDLLNDTAGKQTELQNSENGLIKEQIDLIKGAEESLIELGKEYGTISDKEEIEIVKERQIKDLEVMKKALIDIGDNLKIDVTGQLTIIQGLISAIGQSAKEEINFQFFDDVENDLFNINQLVNASDKLTAERLLNAETEIKDAKEKEKQKNIITLQGELNRLMILTEYGDKTTAEYAQQMLRIKEIGNELTQLQAPEPDENFWKGVNSFEDLWNKTIDKIFEDPIQNQKFREFTAGLGSALQQFGQIANEATQIALANIDKQLDKLSERRTALEEDLDYELQLQAEGLANSAVAKQEEVDKLISEEERLTKEREKLQREQQRRQLAAETAQQAAALVTSSINIIKGSTNFLGPAGLAVAIPVIASMFAFFAKTKADAFKATRLHTGADRVSDYFGFADRYGDTDLPGRGNGYKVVSSKTGRDTGVIISGREMIVPEKFSIPNQDFFTNLRMGHYDGIDLDSAIRFSQSFKQQNTTSKIVERQVIQPQQKQKQRVLLQVSDKKYTLVTIDESMRDGQIIEIDL